MRVFIDLFEKSIDLFEKMIRGLGQRIAKLHFNSMGLSLRRDDIVWFLKV